MENYEHIEASSGNKKDKVSWKPFARQVLVCSGIWCCYFINGLAVGAPTVLIPQLRREANSTDAVSMETASWLSSICGFAGIPWVPILPVLSHYYGRRWPYRLICVVSLASSILFYCSTSITHIFISEALTSILSSGTITVFLVILLEYTSPKYRGVFLTIKSASFNWGIWISNALGTWLHWKSIGIVHIVCSIYIFISALFWTESPYWLARKERQEECTKSFHWLRGFSSDGNKELRNIIEDEKRIQENKDTLLPIDNDKSTWKILSTKTIYKPAILCMLLVAFYYTNGKIVCTIYALDIVKQISNSESRAYAAMLILDGTTVFSMYVACALSRILRRKVMFITGACLGICFLLTLSLYLYLVQLSVVGENKYVTIGLLVGYFIAICCGPLLLSTTIIGELLPLRFRNSFVCFIAIYDRTVSGLFLKISPYVFYSLGAHGSFLLFAILTTILLVILNKFLPETKDKTLHEIQNNWTTDNNN